MTSIISKALNDLNLQSKNIVEGIEYNKGKEEFTFNWKSDNKMDALCLSSNDLYESVFEGNVYYYGYQLNKNVRYSSSLIRWLKEHSDNEDILTNIRIMISKAVKGLGKEISLSDLRVCIYPDYSTNNVLKELRESIFNLTKQADVSFYSTIKNLPIDVRFNQTLYEDDKPQIYKSGNKQIIEDDRKRVSKYMEEIHSMETFHISKTRFKPDERKYLSNFLVLKDEKAEKTLKELLESNEVLIIDDCLTSGTTMNELIRIVRKFNLDCDIIIFSLINGKNKYDVRG